MSAAQPGSSSGAGPVPSSSDGEFFDAEYGASGSAQSNGAQPRPPAQSSMTGCTLAPSPQQQGSQNDYEATRQKPETGMPAGADLRSGNSHTRSPSTFKAQTHQEYSGVYGGVSKWQGKQPVHPVDPSVQKPGRSQGGIKSQAASDVDERGKNLRAGSAVSGQGGSKRPASSTTDPRSLASRVDETAGPSSSSPKTAENNRRSGGPESAPEGETPAPVGSKNFLNPKKKKVNFAKSDGTGSRSSSETDSAVFGSGKKNTARSKPKNTAATSSDLTPRQLELARSRDTLRKFGLLEGVTDNWRKILSSRKVPAFEENVTRWLELGPSSVLDWVSLIQLTACVIWQTALGVPKAILAKKQDDLRSSLITLMTTVKGQMDELYLATAPYLTGSAKKYWPVELKPLTQVLLGLWSPHLRYFLEHHAANDEWFVSGNYSMLFDLTKQEVDHSRMGGEFTYPQAKEFFDHFQKMQQALENEAVTAILYVILFSIWSSFVINY